MRRIDWRRPIWSYLWIGPIVSLQLRKLWADNEVEDGIWLQLAWHRLDKKSLLVHIEEGHDEADGYQLTILTHACQTNGRYRCDKMSKLDQGPVLLVPSLILLINRTFSSVLPIFCFLGGFLLCFPFRLIPLNSPDPRVKDQLATSPGQVIGSQQLPKRKRAEILGGRERSRWLLKQKSSELLTVREANMEVITWLWCSAPSLKNCEGVHSLNLGLCQLFWKG